MPAQKTSARRARKPKVSAPTSSAAERRFSGKLSDDYPLWRLARPFLDDVHGALAKELSRVTKNHTGSCRVLDVGMGDGAITGLLLAYAEFDVLGVDNEPKMLDRARQRLGGAIEEGRLTICLDDALHFLAERPAHSLDIVASGYVLHNLTAGYRQRLYAEIWRVLTPSGMFINADKYAQHGEAHRDALKWQLGQFFDVLERRNKIGLLREWVLHYVEDETAERVMPETDAIECLKRLGFESVEIIFRKYMDAVLVARKPATDLTRRVPT